jgi:hypothetical protein
MVFLSIFFFLTGNGEIVWVGLLKPKVNTLFVRAGAETVIRDG